MTTASTTDEATAHKPVKAQEEIITVLRLKRKRTEDPVSTFVLQPSKKGKSGLSAETTSLLCETRIFKLASSVHPNKIELGHVGDTENYDENETKTRLQDTNELVEKLRELHERGRQSLKLNSQIHNTSTTTTATEGEQERAASPLQQAQQDLFPTKSTQLSLQDRKQRLLERANENSKKARFKIVSSLRGSSETKHGVAELEGVQVYDLVKEEIRNVEQSVEQEVKRVETRRATQVVRSTKIETASEPEKDSQEEGDYVYDLYTLSSLRTDTPVEDDEAVYSLVWEPERPLYFNDEEETDSEKYGDEEEDSNAEDWWGNEYPDSDEVDYGYQDDMYGSEDEDEYDDGMRRWNGEDGPEWEADEELVGMMGRVSIVNHMQSHTDSDDSDNGVDVD